jgi:hypothetical protein
MSKLNEFSSEERLPDPTVDEQDNEEQDLLDELDQLFDDVAETPEKDRYDSTELIEGLESVIDGTSQVEMEFDQDTQSFLDELSDFLDEEDTSYLDETSEYNLPGLDEQEEDEYLPSLDELEDEDYNEEAEESYGEDDEETKVLRAETANIALGLMNYVEYNVVMLENELTVLGDAFNQLLDKTHELDDKISRLSEKVTKARLEGYKQALEFIHDEIKLISDNLEGAIKSTDPNDREVLQENVDILNENKLIIEQQIQGLKEIGTDTVKLEHDLKVLEVSIVKLNSAINSNEVFSVAFNISNEINQTISQISEARVAEDSQDIAILQENLDLLMENRGDIEERIWDLAEKDIDIEGLQEQLEVLNINLEQFSRTIDETIHNISMSTKRR